MQCQECCICSKNSNYNCYLVGTLIHYSYYKPDFTPGLPNYFLAQAVFFLSRSFLPYFHPSFLPSFAFFPICILIHSSIIPLAPSKIVQIPPAFFSTGDLATQARVFYPVTAFCSLSKYFRSNFPVLLIVHWARRIFSFSQPEVGKIE